MQPRGEQPLIGSLRETYHIVVAEYMASGQTLQAHYGILMIDFKYHMVV